MTAGAAGSAGPVVLLVEDDSRIASFITRALGALRFTVVWVATAQEGLAHVVDGTPAVAVLDLNLPDMDGLELLRVLRGRGHHLPVIIVTARNDPADREIALSLGVRTYLRKPFPLTELLNAVRSAAGLDAGAAG